MHSSRIIDAGEAEFYFSWPAADARNGLIIAHKQYCPIRTYDKGLMRWIVPAEPAAIARLWEFGEKYDFSITTTAEDLYNRILGDVGELPKFPGRRIYLAENKHGKLAFHVLTDVLVPGVYQTVSTDKLSHYVHKTGAWAMPMESVEKVKGLADKFHFTMTGDVRARMDAEIAGIKAKQAEGLRRVAALNSAALRIPGGSFGGKTPRKYQIDAIGKMLGASHGAILADDMGLGKTLTAALHAGCYQHAFGAQIIVLCPKSVRGAWQKEGKACGLDIKPFTWGKIPPPPKTPFVLIADEAQYAQTLRSDRTQAMLRLAEAPGCLYAAMVTGSPFRAGRFVKLFPLLRAIKHPLGEDWKYFTDQYCAPSEYHTSSGKRRDVTGHSNEAELMREIAPVFIRRTKEQVAADLPPRNIIQKPIDVDANAQAIYKDLFDNARRAYQERRLDKIQELAEQKGVDYDAMKKKLDGAEEFVLLGILRRAASVAKVSAVADMADEILDQGRSVVIFVEFLQAAHKLADYYKAARIPYELLTGASKDRESMVERFQAGTSKVWISTTGSGGTGITLHAASDVIIADPSWIWDDIAQAVDRCHRIGQTRPVMGYLLAAFEIDVKIHNRLFEQRDLLAKLLKGESVQDAPAINRNQFAKKLIRDVFEVAA